MTAGTTKIFFRADGSNKIGLGHVVRSSALAQMLDGDFECHFFIRETAENIITLVRQYCAHIHLLPATQGLEKEARQLAASMDGSEIVVLDGYHFTGGYQRIIRSKGSRLVCIDDTHSTTFIADAIINTAGGIQKNVYAAAPYSCFYLGPQYALLRPSFQPAPKMAERENAVLICLGGADPRNMTLQILQVLQSKNISQKCHVVLGGAFLHRETIDEFVRNTPLKIVLHQNLQEDELAVLMKNCQYAVCPPSTVSYEYLAVGGELYLVQIADNQQHLYDFLTQTGLAFDFSRFGKEDEAAIRKSRLLQARCFDGKAGIRHTRLFHRLAGERFCTLREATATDVDVLFDWANEPGVRKNSLRSDSIPYAAHVQWFEQKLRTADRTKIYILEKVQVPVGQIRLDVAEDGETAVIGYSIDANFRGQGLGLTIVRLMILQLLQTAKHIRHLKAVVKEDNIPSLQVFELLNFDRRPDTVHYGHRCREYTLTLGA